MTRDDRRRLHCRVRLPESARVVVRAAGCLLDLGLDQVPRCPGRVVRLRPLCHHLHAQSRQQGKAVPSPQWRQECCLTDVGSSSLPRSDSLRTIFACTHGAVNRLCKTNKAATPWGAWRLKTLGLTGGVLANGAKTGRSQAAYWGASWGTARLRGHYCFKALTGD